MNYSNLRTCDIANGKGIRVSLFVSGCPHKCKGCFNEEAFSFDAGDEYTKDIEDKIINELKHDYIKGLSLLGGEPLCLENQETISNLITHVKKEFGDTKDIWCYTGYVYNENIPDSEWKENILNNVDILVDGPFIEDEKDITLKFRGSSNQRLIDMKETLKEGKVVLKEY
jgi:anaerobic ribonucleoside-triphosphate reductase activating protein